MHAQPIRLTTLDTTAKGPHSATHATLAAAYRDAAIWAAESTPVGRKHKLPTLKKVADALAAGTPLELQIFTGKIYNGEPCTLTVTFETAPSTPAPAAEPQLFQPGQQVRRTITTTSGPAGEQGTIICLFNPAGPPRYNVKWVSGGITVGVEQHGLADNTPPAPAAKLAPVALAILKGESREIEICLNNGQRVKVYGSNGGYVQYGANELGTAESWNAYQLTQPIAQRWAKWLNTGKGAPKPSTRYTEYQDLHAYEQDTAQY